MFQPDKMKTPNRLKIPFIITVVPLLGVGGCFKPLKLQLSQPSQQSIVQTAEAIVGATGDEMKKGILGIIEQDIRDTTGDEMKRDISREEISRAVLELDSGGYRLTYDSTQTLLEQIIIEIHQAYFYTLISDTECTELKAVIFGIEQGCDHVTDNETLLTPNTSGMVQYYIKTRLPALLSLFNNARNNPNTTTSDILASITDPQELERIYKELQILHVAQSTLSTQPWYAKLLNMQSNTKQGASVGAKKI